MESHVHLFNNRSLLKPDSIIGQFAVTNNNCAGAATGSINLVSASGENTGAGTPTSPRYTYTVDGGTATPIGTAVTGLTDGPHTVVIRDAAGCLSASQQLFISTTNQITGRFTVTNATCNGLANGTITLTTASGGTPGIAPNTTYTFSVDGGTPTPESEQQLADSQPPS